MGWFSSVFPRGMRRRWWLFRPIDALVALWPGRSPRRGLLVVRMDGIGDMVMARAALEHYPAAFGTERDEITLLGCHSWRGLAAEVFPGLRVVTIDEHAFEKKWLYRLKIALWVRRQGFASAVCDMYMRKTLTADSLVWASRAPSRIVAQPFVTDRTRAEYGWYLARATQVIDTGPYPTHEGLRHFAFLDAVTGRPHPPEAVRIPWRERVPALANADAAPYVVINFGSNEPGRRWPFESFLAVARRCLESGLRVVFVGAGQEAFAKPAIAALAHPGAIDTIGTLSLPDLIDVMKHAACVVSNDTGPGHLALGVGAPTVLLIGGGHFGSFVPYPEAVRPAGAAFLSVEMECYHCLWRCPKRASPDEAFPCVAAIPVETVWQAVRERTASHNQHGHGKDAGMKVLVVGSGGREHALCWKLAQSPLLTKLWCAPGNAGIADIAECVAIAAEAVEDLVAFARAQAVDLVVIGPEAPLVAGLADRCREAGLRVFGPSAAAAELEGSKGFMKDVVAKAGIPTAWYGRFQDSESAKAFIRAKGAPIVVKTDGLAAGKGVVVAMTEAEALDAVDAMMGDKVFGAAGDELVIEEFLEGEECSFFALCDGRTALPLAAAQDHKRVGDGDTGPNTGGMGAYSPTPVVTPAIEAAIVDTCIRPLIATMAALGRPYSGVLFAGIMVTATGPKLLEYNVRFGDPECQVLMARLESDLLPVLIAGAEGRLDQINLSWRDAVALVVVMAANGYPGAYQKGSVIGGLEAAGAIEGVTVLHAGTALKDGQVIATGGRVLGVTAIGTDVAEARERAYRAVDALDWPGGFCRRDIAWRALAR